MPEKNYPKSGLSIKNAERKIKTIARTTAEKEMQKAVEVAKDLIETARVKAVATLDGPNPSRYIDISRVPLICQSIIGIHESLKEISENMVNQDQFGPVKAVVYGLVTVILLGVVGALVALVVR